MEDYKPPEKESWSPDWWFWIITAIIIMAMLSSSQDSNSGSTSTGAQDIAPTYQDARGSGDCTDDCSGHDAGYQWGEDNDVCDSDYSGGKSESFDEGVQAWAEDNCS